MIGFVKHLKNIYHKYTYLSKTIAVFVEIYIFSINLLHINDNYFYQKATSSCIFSNVYTLLVQYQCILIIRVI